MWLLQGNCENYEDIVRKLQEDCKHTVKSAGSSPLWAIGVIFAPSWAAVSSSSWLSTSPYKKKQQHINTIFLKHDPVKNQSSSEISITWSLSSSPLLFHLIRALASALSSMTSICSWHESTFDSCCTTCCTTGCCTTCCTTGCCTTCC